MSDQHPSHRLLAASLPGLVLATVFGLTAILALTDERPTREPGKPTRFAARGTLVCLLEEMKTLHQADVPPVHEHLLGFRLASVPATRDPDAEAGAPKPIRYYSLLRTSLSEALFVDERFKDRELRLFGRVFPQTALLEVSRFQWARGDRLFDVYYWCEVCSIKGVDPGPCACCQGDVELREAPAEEDASKE